MKRAGIPIGNKRGIIIVISKFNCPFIFLSPHIFSMAASVYLRRLEPALYEVKPSELVSAAGNFYTQTERRMAIITDLLIG